MLESMHTSTSLVPSRLGRHMRASTLPEVAAVDEIGANVTSSTADQGIRLCLPPRPPPSAVRLQGQPNSLPSIPNLLLGVLVWLPMYSATTSGPCASSLSDILPLLQGWQPAQLLPGYWYLNTCSLRRRYPWRPPLPTMTALPTLMKAQPILVYLMVSLSAPLAREVAERSASAASATSKKSIVLGVSLSTMKKVSSQLGGSACSPPLALRKRHGKVANGLIWVPSASSVCQGSRRSEGFRTNTAPCRSELKTVWRLPFALACQHPVSASTTCMRTIGASMEVHNQPSNL
mmetsp:Transcript_100611/g.199880  ORF Transcript_100611/g.199880 Transcript_100611/m.199880 type:complete len:290 (+) Transcript_100611:1736-2605(+)